MYNCENCNRREECEGRDDVSDIFDALLSSDDYVDRLDLAVDCPMYDPED